MADGLWLLIVFLVLLLIAAAAVEGMAWLQTRAADAVDSWKGEGNAPLGLRAVLAVIWRRWLCGRMGHREDFNISFERVWISCSRCGWESRGVQLHPSVKRVA
jgi:hypothetical protein